MRLICPNCDAQYEVPDEVMPPEGRDVQCSNCGQTWFQDHPDAVPDIEEEVTGPQAAGDEDRTAAPKKTAPEPEAAPPETPAAAAPGAPASGPGLADEQPEDTPPEAPARRRVDPAVASVLQEEAELEAQARRNEMADSLESQPDLGLPETDARDDADRTRGADQDTPETGDQVTPAPGQMQDAAAVAAAAAGSRRDLLPDIEEINSTLRSNNDRNPGSDPGQTAQAENREKRSSRRGFVLVIAIVAVMALVYVYAPQLAEAMPQFADALQTYVTVIDSWRAWLDGKVAGFLSWLDAVAVSSSQ
ncbi:zinc-ribbon domain-containing protein [Roseobacter sp. S98]|uniref:zinc-ribbon domain-containing protein n=1 Tax=Roseobacter algicola (ex Choi et al. 2025) (nom. illeg.) TaxID=3092138 RepID=UPI0035C734E2